MAGASWVCRCGAVASRTLRAAPWYVAVLLLGACASAPATHASAPARASAKAETGRKTATASEPHRFRAENGRAALDLAPHVAPNSTARQIAFLRQAKAQYQAFIVRAKDRPDMHDAVVRSRERIEDIDKTIDFLEDKNGARVTGAE